MMVSNAFFVILGGDVFLRWSVFSMGSVQLYTWIACMDASAPRCHLPRDIMQVQSIEPGIHVA
jgi:hypothetical protein